MLFEPVHIITYVYTDRNHLNDSTAMYVAARFVIQSDYCKCLMIEVRTMRLSKLFLMPLSQDILIHYPFIEVFRMPYT